MTASRLEKAVPFPEFGADHVLRFTTGDLIALEDHCRDALVRAETPADAQREALNIPWTRVLQQRFDAKDPRFVQHAVRLGLKKPGGYERVKMAESEWDDLPFAPAEIVHKLVDAIICAINGRAYADVLAEREAEEAAAKEAAQAAA